MQELAEYIFVNRDYSLTSSEGEISAPHGAEQRELKTGEGGQGN